MRPRCSVLKGAFDFSGCGDFTSCPPAEPAEMSNSDPSAIVLHGVPCIGGLYISFNSNGEIGSLKLRRDVRPEVSRDSPLRITREVSNRLGIAPGEPGLRDWELAHL